MARGRQAHPRIEGVAGPAAERAARSAQAVACDVGAALPSFAAAPWVNAEPPSTGRQRDGTSRDGERGRLYSATQDRTDGDAFLDRGKDDRHQFRVIVSPEDGAELGDLSGFTRDLIGKIEADLGTKLDWVAVNHFNTGHPHIHVIINGRDELDEDLVINGDYIAHGIRERASELMTLELGPVTAIEQQRKLAAEIDQDRFTRIDRALIAEAGEGLVDLRVCTENLNTSVVVMKSAQDGA